MGSATALKRPWLAAGLTFIVTGLGHIYLRRWTRAFGWFVAIGVSMWLFVPESALIGGRLGFWDSAPVGLIGALSVVDAYLLAYYNNTRLQIDAGERCPSCYQGLDTELSFCPWCGTDLSVSSGQHRHGLKGGDDTEGR